MLEVKDIAKNFKGVQALKGVSATFHKGEIHGIVGENGAGKSTLMKIISGVFLPDRGALKLDGQDIYFNNPIEAYNAGVRIVHQELSIIPSLSIAENIFIHKFRQGSPVTFVQRKVIEKEAEEILEEWGIEVEPDMMVSNVSMGVRQLVEIARVLSTKGKILLLDEPTSSLTDNEIDKLFEVLEKLKDRGYIIIFISHRLNEVTELVDRVTVLRDGEIVATELIENISSEQICNYIAGKDMSKLFPKIKAEIGDVALEVKNLSGQGFKDISFQLRWGEVIGIGGLMGAGRSELMRAIFGVNTVMDGEMYFEGEKIIFNNPWEAIEKGLVMLSESRSEEGIFPDLNVSKNLVMTKLKDILKNYLFLDNGKIGQKTSRLVKALNIITYNSQQQLISQLSGGNQQKVIMGRLLGAAPKILLLDEPTRGVDIANKTEIHKIMGNFLKEGGAIIMISSEIEELMGISDKIMVLHEGEYAGTFNRNEFDKEVLIRCMMGLKKVI